MAERNRVSRAPEDILIAILTQTESQLNGLSTVQITIDHKSPDLQNIALESTRNLFVQQSADTYKASQINISIFINILIGVKANGWTLMGTNAFLNNAKQEVVKTFYFEKIGAGKALTAVKLNNSTSSSNPSMRSPQSVTVTSSTENGKHFPGMNGIAIPVRGTPESSPRDMTKNSPRDAARRQATEEQKDSRINGTTAVVSAPPRRNTPPEPDQYMLASQREVAMQQREMAAQKEAASQREALQREATQREAAIQATNQREAVQQKEVAMQREAAIQREAASQREAANQRERDSANQRERELLASQRDVANQKERDAASQREKELIAQRERETGQRATQHVDYPQRSLPPPPIDTKSPNNSGPGAIDFNKFPARLRPSPTAKGDKAASIAPSDIQKKNAEYFKRMKKEQDQEKKKLEEEELKLDVTELRRRKEVAALAEAHENSKTAHFSRLGANFVPGRDILSAAARGTTPKGPI